MTKRITMLVAGLMMLVGTFVLALPARADDPATAGRTIAAKWQHAVVTVEFVTKSRMSVNGNESTDEQKGEENGVIIDPSGLVVGSLSQISASDSYMAMMAEQQMNTSKENMSLNCDTTDIKIRMDDGRELPAKIVLRDKDLDLVFIRPTQAPAQPLPSLQLDKPSSLALLDPIILMYRMPMVANRTINVTLDRIAGIVEKPRKFYIPSAPALGAPVFSLDGNLVGIQVSRMLKSGKLEESDITTIILPATDIAEVAKQAPAMADSK